MYREVSDGSPRRGGGSPRRGPRQVPPPINTQRQTPTGPAPIMRQGRFLSPGGGTSGGGTSGTPRGYGGYSGYGHPSQQPPGPPHNPLSPSQVRFEEGSDDPNAEGGPGSHSASFLFEAGDWSDSDSDNGHEGGGDRAAGGGGRSSRSPALPSEAQLSLLCLDYLRDLRRTYRHKEDLLNAEGLHADYVALAAWSLSRAFVRPERLVHSDAKVSTVAESIGRGRTVESNMYGGGGLGGLEDETVGNDAWYRQLDDDVVVTDAPKKPPLFSLSATIRLPKMEDITDEVLLRHPDEEPSAQRGGGNGGDEEEEDDDDDDEPFYEHNDAHPSNAHRFYLLHGLASDAASHVIEGLATPRGGTPRGAPPSGNAGLAGGGPLSFGEIVSAGLAGLRARSRLEADREMVRNPLFRQFVDAASAGGFFQEKRGEKARERNSPDKAAEPVPSPEEEERRARLAYEERYRKVVAKFRTKLAAKEAQTLQGGTAPYGFGAASPSRTGSAYRIMSGNASVGSAGGDSAAMNAVAANCDVAERRRRRRERRIERVKSLRGRSVVEEFVGREAQDAPEETERPTEPPKASPARPKPAAVPPPSPAANLPHYREAERLSAEGNALMQRKSFKEALETYTAALKLAPAGPNSHVYYSNRSAAHLSLNDYASSIGDSERSLALKPDYAKAHSRLGLAYFAGGRYEEAVKSYEAALEIDPDNEWSRTHLEKAQEKLKSGSGGKAEGADAVKEAKAGSSSWPTPFDDGDAVVEEARVEMEAVAVEEEGKKDSAEDRQVDEEELEVKVKLANRHKDRGNVHMANKEYEKALEQYHRAIDILPSGPNSHVYLSNRAAAYCYLAEYDAAASDCRKSIALSPEYEKAHARLGLSLFFQGDYGGAIDAYRRSLELDPTNKASSSYLLKAEARLKEQQREEEERQQLQEQQVSQQSMGEEGGEEEDERSLNTGITSTGLTSIVTNDNETSFEVEVMRQSPGIPEHQEAFDPFATTDE